VKILLIYSKSFAMVRIKVCGITNREDALLSVDLGVDALGFIFAPSPRGITPQEAKKIIQVLPPFIERVGVFVNEASWRVRTIAKFCSLTCLQFHGDESPHYCVQFNQKVIKSFSLKDKIPKDISHYKVSAYLVDTFLKGKRGGTGKTCNWEIARKIRNIGFSLILSGGLTPNNVGEAIIKVKPYAVDVASGVEEMPGKKSEKKLRQFIQNVREKNETLQITHF